MNKYSIPGVTTFEYTKIVGLENIEFGDNIIIDDFVFIYAKKPIRIGNYIHISSFSSITGGESLFMEDFSGLSSGVRIFTATDDFNDWGFGNPTIDAKYRNVRRAPVHIGKFAIIGANSVVLPGVSIGEGTSVSAGSVITKDLGAWGVYIGNRRVSDRNEAGILSNYERFLNEQ